MDFEIDDVTWEDSDLYVSLDDLETPPAESWYTDSETDVVTEGVSDVYVSWGTDSETDVVTEEDRNVYVSLDDLETLPAEIWVMVLEHMFIFDTDGEGWDTYKDPELISHKWPNIFFNDVFKLLPRLASHPQMAHEAERILWTSNLFWFSNPWCLECFVESINRRGVAGFIRNLRLDFPPLDDHSTAEWLRIIPTIQEGLPRLEKLSIEFQAHTGDVEHFGRFHVPADAPTVMNGPMGPLVYRHPNFTSVRDCLVENLKAKEVEVWGLEDPDSLPKEALML